MEAQIERGIERGSVDAKNWVSFLFFGQRTCPGVLGKKSNPAHDRSHFPSHLSHPFIAQHWAPHPLMRPLICSLPVYSLLFSGFLPPISPPIRPVCIHIWVEPFSLEKEFNSSPPPFSSPLIFRKLIYPTSFEVLFLLPLLGCKRHSPLLESTVPTPLSSSSFLCAHYKKAQFRCQRMDLLKTIMAPDVPGN